MSILNHISAKHKASSPPIMHNINLPDASLNDVQDTPRELGLIRSGNEWRGWAQASHRWQPFVGSQEYVQLHIHKKISDFTKRGNKHGLTNISLRWGTIKNDLLQQFKTTSKTCGMS
jgi:hypothetical protein